MAFAQFLAIHIIEHLMEEHFHFKDWYQILNFFPRGYLLSLELIEKQEKILLKLSDWPWIIAFRMVISKNNKRKIIIYVKC